MRLKIYPEEWGIFQHKFNAEMDNLFTQIISFEKRCIRDGKEDELLRIKELFIKRLRKYFYYGDLPKWSIDKPYGYAGDFKIIDDIYKNSPTTTGYDRLFDNYFLTSAISTAVRNRKEDFKREILKHVNQYPLTKKLEIMNLASGSAREIKEFLVDNNGVRNRVHFNCFDIEPKAHEYAKELLREYKNVSFIVENIIKLALIKDINRKVGKGYDFIYSTGLFDYLNHKTSVKLIANLKNLLNEGGALLIANVRDRYYNPSVFNMEWACGWDLVYRSDNDFRKIFIDAGFNVNKLCQNFEQQGIMQYIKAVK